MTIKVFFNNSCNVCRIEINHYKKIADSNLEWIDITNNDEALKLTSKDLKKMGIIDGIIKEPLGGAHNDVDLAAKRIKKVILNDIEELGKLNPEKRINKRIDKFSNMGVIND